MCARVYVYLFLSLPVERRANQLNGFLISCTTYCGTLRTRDQLVARQDNTTERDQGQTYIHAVSWIWTRHPVHQRSGSAPQTALPLGRHAPVVTDYRPCEHAAVGAWPASRTADSPRSNRNKHTAYMAASQEEAKEVFSFCCHTN